MTYLRRYKLIVLLGLLAFTACDDTEIVQTSSLEGPRSTILVRGDVCVDTFLNGTVLEGTTRLCEEGEKSNLGLVASSHDDRVGIIDFYPADYNLGAENSELRPRFLDIDPGTPGVTHLEVGRLPVAVAASPDGRVGYTLNQLDRTISVVDLLALEVLQTRYHLDSTPIAFAVAPDGTILTLGGVPSKLSLHAGTTCDDGCDVPDAEPTELPLGGTATDIEINPSGTRAFVTYRDLDLLSVVALDEDGLGDDGCLDQVAPPCVTAEVPLTFGCRDGIDNDGDGLTDRDDPQCLSPLGAEAPVDGGPSRALATACNDGLDNDGDGFIDLDDPECIASGGISEEWDDDPVVTACNDGLDNDGDGRIDLDDEACYSAAGRTESMVPTLGFDAVSVDEGGFLAWVLDTANNQVLLVDAQRLKLIDVPAVAEPPYDQFVSRLGISVPASPISLDARVDGINGEFFLTGAYDPEPSYYRAIYSALIGVDNGQAYNVVAGLSYCDTDSTDCLLFPELPLQAETPACGFAECACEDGEDGEECVCPTEEYLETHQRCGEDGSRVLFNPVFDVENASTTSARIVGLGRCEIPGDYVEELNDFALQNPGAPANPAACDSELLPQPRSLAAPSVTDETPLGDVELEGLGRADIVSRSRTAFTVAQRDPRFITEPWSARVRNQTWTVAYEGVLPRTRRGDWVLPTAVGTTSIDGEELETITLDASTDVCAAGVEVGDTFVLTTDPLGRDGCDALDSEDDLHRSYEIVARDADTIVLTTIDGRAPLPVRAAEGESGCYESGVSGEIRPTGDWVVSGERTGYLSSQASRNGRCVPSRIPEAADGRVATGESYVGPSLQFRIYEGFVAPERGLTFEFDTESGFVSDRIRLGPTSESVGLLPYDLYFHEAADSEDVEFLIASDPDSNFVFVRTTAIVENDEQTVTRATVTELLD